MAGAKGRSGGKREGSGRKPGVPNKATAEIKAIARKHGPAAIAECLRIMKNSDSDQARIAAAKEIMDRGYGKPPQAIIGDEDGPPVKTILEVMWVTPSAAKS